MLRWTTALSIALATSAAALPAHAQVWVPAWTASPAPDRQDGTPEAPVQFAHQTVRQDMRLASSATAFTVLKWLGVAYLLYVGLKLLLSRSGGSPVIVCPSITICVGNWLPDQTVRRPSCRRAALVMGSIVAWAR